MVPNFCVALSRPMRQRGQLTQLLHPLEKLVQHLPCLGLSLGIAPPHVPGVEPGEGNFISSHAFQRPS
eukprot:CAMPEP_0197693446 /NCGR_PEP_ID=MMETSP1338-20131121/112511_1 /TAXON_ID=43686 ORGANISM="Pelagodinium beii, Strain RCC1491" /NCGR_SAMPLE_ID=MMETSP1338 /ASSEMBLY_ACC=CAM_ASM_000754 /LENGTH=67 /DNA_ID=CAMNT_0043276193 /DNA_START=108 /DNA_END=311 /DNA_ORIENTATION=-